MAVYYRYKKLQKCIKYPNGTIIPVVPNEFKRGDLISMDSYPTLQDCECEPQYRWLQVDIDENVPPTYICIDGNIYYKEVYQVSEDCQKTWNNVQPEQYRQGDFYKKVDNCYDLPCANWSIYSPIYADNSDYSGWIIYYGELSTDWNCLSYAERPPSQIDNQRFDIDVTNIWTNIEMNQSSINIQFRLDDAFSTKSNGIIVAPCLGETVKQVMIQAPNWGYDLLIDISSISNHRFESLNNFIAFFDGDETVENNWSMSLDFQQLKNLENVKSMAYMCNTTRFKTIDLSNWNTTNNETLYFLFRDNKILENVNLSNLNTSNVNNMEGMFYGCRKLETIDISTLDFTKVENIRQMFRFCESLKNIIGLDKLCTEVKLTNNLFAMFADCSNLESISLEGIDLLNVPNPSSRANMANLFENCEKLKYIKLNNIKNAQNGTFDLSTFNNCTSLETIDFSNSAFDGVDNRLFLTNKNLKQINLSGCTSTFIDDIEAAISYAGLTKQVYIIK